MLKAAVSHFGALRDRTVANLNAYLQNPVGVGEHADLVGEVVRMVEDLDRANHCIELLKGLTSQADAIDGEE